MTARRRKWCSLERREIVIPPNRTETFTVGGVLIAVKTGDAPATLVYVERIAEQKSAEPAK